MSRKPNPGDWAGALERDGLVALGQDLFALSAGEIELLDAAAPRGASKSISLAPGSPAACRVDPRRADQATALMTRYATWTNDLVCELAPAYAGQLERGRTSLRTRAIEGGQISARKDDRRLHVDAFASQPTAGRRILRVFSNVNPRGQPRLWQVGEAFEDHARRWIDRVRRPFPGEAWMLRRLGVTKARRTGYDALMLGLHDAAKLDGAYQRQAPRRDLAFAAGASWIVYTDSTVHAALSGRHALEQTFYLPVEAMIDPGASPLRILERLTGRRLG